MKLKIDMHVHSYYSSDSLITPEKLVLFAKKRGLNGVAITDHDTLEGSSTIAKKTDLLIIPGLEIASLDGHILGLNVQQLVSSGLSADETIDRIHQTGGIAVACHPTGLLKGGIGERATSRFDAIEVINSSAMPFSYSVKQNEQIARKIKRSRVAGSDAHYAPEIGMAYTLIDTDPNVDSVINAILKGSCKPFGRATPLYMRFRKIVALRRRSINSAE